MKSDTITLGYCCLRFATQQALKPLYLKNEMKPEIMKTENKLFEPKAGRSVLRTLVVGTAFLLLLGLLIDAFNGFYILRHSKSVYAGCVGFFLLSVFYMLGEAGSSWINSKDKITHPWYRRIFHLLMLLIYAGLIMVAAGVILKYLSIIKI